MGCCDNALMTRYQVRFEEECAPVGFIETVSPTKIWKEFTKVGGLALGDEGTIEVPEWDRKVKISDGIRVVEPVPLSFRVDKKAPGTAFAMVMEWADKRHDVCRTLYVDRCDRAWNPLWTWKFSGCQMLSLPKEEDQELGATKLAIWSFSLTPYDVTLLDGDGTTVLVRGVVGTP